MARSTDAQKAERLNAAHSLLARGTGMAEAVVSLSRQFGLSRRQAYHIASAHSHGGAVALAAGPPHASAVILLQRSRISLSHSRMVPPPSRSSSHVSKHHSSDHAGW